MLHRILATALATLALFAASASSHARPLVDVSVVDRDTGESLARYPHRGDLWIAGSPGHRYSVRLANTTGERILVVLSVDGINAVTGQTADPSQAGYVLEPWQTTEINGWRKSLDDVAQFVFTDLGDSYAARTGRPRNVGVIGVAAFREASAYRYPRYEAPPIARGTMNKRAEAEAAAPAGSSRSIAADEASRQQSIGTGHGGREWAPTSRTGFERATRQPEQVSELRYDEHRRLVAMGILPRRHQGPIWRDDTPRAFPGGFVADPPRRR